MKTLYTAFKGAYNTSYQLVSKTQKHAVYLTNSFQGLEKDISLIDDGYDTVIMFGIDKCLMNEVRIDICARYNEDLLYSSFDIKNTVTKFKEKDLNYSVSDKPTAYLCNAAYFHMLKKIPNTIFIHIPSIKGMNDVLMSKLLEVF